MELKSPVDPSDRGKRGTNVELAEGFIKKFVCVSLRIVSVVLRLGVRLDSDQKVY